MKVISRSICKLSEEGVKLRTNNDRVRVTVSTTWKFGHCSKLNLNHFPTREVSLVSNKDFLFPYRASQYFNNVFLFDSKTLKKEQMGKSSEKEGRGKQKYKYSS